MPRAMWAELLLIVAATAGFAVWQWRDLARAKRRTAERRARREAGQVPAHEQVARGAAEHTSPKR